jgi:hypothetical protein
MVGRRFGLPLIRRYGRYIRLDEDRLLIGRYLFFRYGNAVVFFGRFVMNYTQMRLQRWTRTRWDQFSEVLDAASE